MPTYKDASGRWRYRFTANGQRYSGSAPKGGNTRRITERLEAEHVERVSLRTFDGKIPTVGEFAERFLRYQEARTKPLTRVQQRATLTLHVLPMLRSVPIDRVNKEAIDALIARWSKDSQPKTINTRLGTVRRMLSLARDWDMIGAVPKIGMLKIPEARPRFLSDAEISRLIEHAEPRWRSMMFVAVRTGLRVGELRGLQWGDIDLGRRVIHVTRTDPGRRTMDATAPKSNRARDVPLTSDTVAMLLEVRPEAYKASDFVWPALLQRAGESRSRCRSEKGCWHAIDRAAHAAGLADTAWHTLRHTYASHLVMRGVPIRHIQKWLGHATVKETEKYASLAPDAGHDAVDLLDVPLGIEPLRQRAAKTLSAEGENRNDYRPLQLEG